MAKSAKVIDIRTRKRLSISKLRFPHVQAPRAQAVRELHRAGVGLQRPVLPAAATRSCLRQSFQHFFRKSIDAAMKSRANGSWPAKPTR